MVEIIWGDRGVIRRVRGSVRLWELDASAMQIEGSPNFDNIRFVIHDFSECDEFRVTQDEIDIMTARASVAFERHRQFRVAFVGRHPMVQRFVDSFVELAITEHPCRRFDTLSQAQQFIALGLL